MINLAQLESYNNQLVADLREFHEENWRQLYLNGDADDWIRSLSAQEALDYFLQWNGIVGYTDTIVRAVRALDASQQQ